MLQWLNLLVVDNTPFQIQPAAGFALVGVADAPSHIKAHPVRYYRYFLNVLAVILMLTANSAAKGSRMNAGCRLMGSAK